MDLFETILIFLGVQVLYVILNTLKSIWQIKAGKLLASLSSGICYFVYTYLLILTANGSAMSITLKAILTFATNFIGVWVSMWVLEKLKKDKLWKIEATVLATRKSILSQELDNNNISYNICETTNPNEYVFNIYSKNQKESMVIKKGVELVNAKYLIIEEKIKL